MSRPGSESNEVYSFNEELVNNARAAAKQRHEGADLSAVAFDESQSTLSFSGEIGRAHV